MPQTQHTQAAIAITILGIEPEYEFDPDAVQAAYRRLCRTVHPDVCDGPEAARLLSLATDSRDLLLELKPVKARPRPASTGVTFWNWSTTSGSI